MIEIAICDDEVYMTSEIEEMYAQQWFDRCWFSSPMEETFLSYLIDFDQIDTAIETWRNWSIIKNRVN